MHPRASLPDLYGFSGATPEERSTNMFLYSEWLPNRLGTANHFNPLYTISEEAWHRRHPEGSDEEFRSHFERECAVLCRIAPDTGAASPIAIARMVEESLKRGGMEVEYEQPPFTGSIIYVSCAELAGEAFMLQVAETVKGSGGTPTALEAVAGESTETYELGMRFKADVPLAEGHVEKFSRIASAIVRHGDAVFDVKETDENEYAATLTLPASTIDLRCLKDLAGTD